MASHSNCAPVQSELRIWIFASILNRTNYLECCKSVLDKSVARVCSTTVLLKWSVRMFRETARRGIMQTTVFSFVDASVDLTSFFNSGSWFQSCYFFLAFCLLPALNPVESWIWWWKGLSFLFVFFFPTSLCGVLVFRLDPAGAAFASPSAASSSSLPHHSLAHSLTHSLTHALTHSLRRSTESFLAAFRVAGAVHRASWAWQAQYTEPPGGAAARVVAAGAAAAFRVAGAVHRASWAWQAQYTEPPGGAAARVVAAGAAAAFLVAGAVHRATYHHHSSQTHLSHHNFSSPLITTHHTLSHTKSSQLHFSHLTHHSSTAHHNSSQLHFWQVHFSSQLITYLSQPNSWQFHFSHLTSHSSLITSQLLITTHHNLSQPNSWQFHFSHLTSHTSLITSQLLITTHHNLSHPNSSQLHFSHPFSHLT